MNQRLGVLFNVWGRVLAWSILASMIGGVLDFAILSLSGPGGPSAVDFGIIAVFGPVIGFSLGVLTGFIDGLGLGLLMAIGSFQASTSPLERWLLCGVSALVAAICTAVALSYIQKYILLPALIEAIAGLVVAHRVLTHEPRKKKNDESALVER